MRNTTSRRWTRVACAVLAACSGVACAPTSSTLAPAPPALAPALLAPVPGAGAEQTAQPEQASVSRCGRTTASEPLLDFQWPAQGAITSGFGGRGRRTHEGIDISGYEGRAVRAAADGRVVFSERKRGYGRVVILEHANGYRTLYAHNQDNLVWEGVRVKRGRVIAEMGSSGRSSGPHLHFEVRVRGTPVDPIGCLPSRDATAR